MTDLHAWITQQLDAVEADARDATPGPWWDEHPPAQWGEEKDPELVASGGRLAVFDVAENGGLNVMHAARHDPAAVLRRCEADRRILARHRLDPRAAGTDHAAACDGCGVEWVQDYCDPITDNVNDCPELLDLAHAHGLTPEILANLDRPEPPPRKPDAGPRLGHWLNVPTQTAHIPPALRGPNWKADR